MQEKCTSLSIFLGLELLLIDTNDGFPCKLSPEFPTSYQEQIGALNLVWLNIIKVLMEVLRDE